MGVSVSLWAGFLSKRARGAHVKAWRRRYFRLLNGLLVYSTSTTASPKGYVRVPDPWRCILILCGFEGSRIVTVPLCAATDQRRQGPGDALYVHADVLVLAWTQWTQGTVCASRPHAFPPTTGEVAQFKRPFCFTVKANSLETLTLCAPDQMTCNAW